ncbi:RNA polymerase sigma factor SigJ [Nocardiopsis sp. HNM0947]|uniref:RNA polymerase sigma factor SigJ n=1 Tax=Nocardiopsis coralli TaxID=2772213 RepID=A0ABR9P993_9ACTN|nr:RNA polymerase sigma factor SigJ [Nocardiopsis coralli]MBE3000415.1 RNA polymerase sigma factor SigJ [Nocardiopsis coralli]
MTTQTFEAHRPLLTGVAYRVLGDRSEAEDVVQDTWLRWDTVDHTAVDDPRAYLVTTASRLALDRARSARARRESYVGEWLPEPAAPEADAEQRAETADSVGFALLVVLQTLSPLERAVFVLREAFAFPFAEVAEIVGRSEATTRQLARRARDHVREQSPRFTPDRAEHRRITDRFLTASLEGDLDGLTELLTEDAVFVADSGGRTKAPLHALHGPDKVARFLTAIGGRADRFLESAGLPADTPFGLDPTDSGGTPAVVMHAAGRALMLVTLEIEDGRVRRILMVSNPDKLTRVPVPE